MTRTTRPRQLCIALAAAFPLLLAACSGGQYPNSTFTDHRFQSGHDVALEPDDLARARSCSCSSRGSRLRDVQVPATARERPSRSTCTATRRSRSRGRSLPALVLVIIAVPTVQHDLQDQAARAGERAPGRGDRPPVVVGVPVPASYEHHDGQRAVPPDRPHGELRARTADVIHSFWIPALGGKRDLDREPDELSSGSRRIRSATRAFNGSLRRVLRHVPREHALPRVHGDAGGVRQLGAHQKTTAVVPPRPAPAAPAPRHRGDDRRRRKPRPTSGAAAAGATAPSRRRASSFPREKMPAHVDPAHADSGRPDVRRRGARAGRRRSAASSSSQRRRLHRLPHDQRQPDARSASSART